MWGDLLAFFLRRPAISTRIATSSGEEREDYGRRILQRIGVDVTKYSVLNLHRIGVEAPVRYVCEEFLSWNGDSSCWPNHVAKVETIDPRAGKILIRPFGLRRIPFLGLASWKIPPLFELDALRIQRVPGGSDLDNARFMLFSCSGGYPIGIFVLYVRSPIAEQGETEMAQFFLGVSFDFYGKEKWSLFNPVNRIWETVHNRVTANVLNRFKQFCEWRFARTRDDLARSEQDWTVSS